jgi:hypothetical protein
MSKSSGIYNKSNKYEVIINKPKAELDYVNTDKFYCKKVEKYYRD